MRTFDLCRSAAILLLPLLVACGPAPGEAVFTLGGEVMFTGEVRHPVKLAVFYTELYMFDGELAFYEGDFDVQVSNVVDVGSEVDVMVPFELSIDLSAYDADTDTATVLLWEDANDNDLGDVGELRSRVIPAIATGCPVFGEDVTMPAHFTYFEKADPIYGSPPGWNHWDGEWYSAAGDAADATIESEYNFLQDR
jgi:hypothetical protein